MWALAIVLTVAGTAALGALLAGRQRSDPASEIWDITRVSTTFTSIVGTMAGFSVASAIFVANLTVARGAPEFPSVMGMFLIAFIVLIAAAQEFGTTPNLEGRDEDYRTVQRRVYLLAMFGYFVGLAISWHALRVLLLAIDLRGIADVFTWVLLFAVVAGTSRLALQHLYNHSLVPRSVCLAIPAMGLGIAVLFRIVLVPLVPALEPPADEPFAVSVLCFVVAAAGFAFQSVLIMLRDRPLLAARVRHAGDRVLVAFLAAVTVSVDILWASVATA